MIKTASPLVVFDLDQTLLNKQSQLSGYTLQTLRAMDDAGIHYTIATGRSYLSAATILKDHTFSLPQIYTNGVVTWCPTKEHFSFDNSLTFPETTLALKALETDSATPFISAMDDNHQRYLFHGEFKNITEQRMLERFSKLKGAEVLPMSQMPSQLHITNISMIGPTLDIENAAHKIAKLPHLIAYYGQAVERGDFSWIDIHHTDASKGAAITKLKQQLDLDSVICFGDGDNDLSMFAIADECYAPANAKPQIKDAATAVIGHHDDDGVARFLREKFSL